MAEQVEQLDDVGEDTTFEENAMDRLQAKVDKFFDKYGRRIVICIGIAILIAFHVYAGFAIAHNFHNSIPLITLMAITYAGFIYFLGIRRLLDMAAPKLHFIVPIANRIGNFTVFGVAVVQVSAVVIVLAAVILWIIIDSADSKIRRRSIAGMVMFVVFGVLCSANPAKIKWRPVICAIILQFIVGLIVLRWPTGQNAFRWLSNTVVRFLDYTMVGTAFTYGFVSAPPNICGFGSIFIYTSLQIIIYFGAIVSVLYYLGIIEAVLSRIAWLLKYTVGTTAAESLNAAACIFLGQTEAAILIEPALATMTESEVHAVMTAGFACIAGSLFSAYISFGACPQYLLSATVMSAAVSLAMSKIIYPEIQVSRQKEISSFKFKTRSENNILECISNGACHSAKFVFAIGANLIVYLALLAFLNTAVWWFGNLLGAEDLSFNKILGYCFFPLAYVMGASDAPDKATEIDETLKVAELMGMKTVLNEFIAYQHLYTLMHPENPGDPVLKGVRAQMIATYALCGFSNISMIGSQMGILSSMCPKRKSIFARVVVRALIAGCFSCFMTACVAGMLVSDPTKCDATVNANCLNLDDVVTYFNLATATGNSTTAALL